MDYNAQTIRTLHTVPPAGCSSVLLVAGNDGVRNALRTWLEVSFPRCRFLEAATLEEALVLAVDVTPQAAVLLLGRAVPSNVRLIRAMKAAMPHLHIVAVSGHETPEYRTEVRDAGASAVVATPDLGTDLIPTVGRFLDQSDTT